MFAVVKTGGKQYRVATDDTITVMSLPGAPGEAITLHDVLMITDGASTDVGTPLVAGASVGAEIVEQTRGPKVIAFKKRRRKNSKRKRGHRQDLTLLRITGIGVGGAAPQRRTADASPEAPASQPHEQAADSQPHENLHPEGSQQVETVAQTEPHATESSTPGHAGD